MGGLSPYELLAVGLVSFIAALFVPEIHVWFSPSDDWRFVGGQFTRCYKGPEIILALVPKRAERNRHQINDVVVDLVGISQLVLELACSEYVSRRENITCESN